MIEKIENKKVIKMANGFPDKNELLSLSDERTRLEDACILQAKSLEECSEKFRTLPALMFLVISYSIKRVSHGNCHQ